ncbi:MAG: glycosyltransferase family 4 protein [Alphaproteobacteria bacterium]|nr:glycosyltransferase family 4 protein [Alphaproteobacteria bacterium]
MHLGVVPLLDGNSGGVYQYSLSVLRALGTPGVLSANDRVTLFVHDPKAPVLARVKQPEWKVLPLSPPTWRQRISRLARYIPGIKMVVDRIRANQGKGAPREPADLDRPRYNHALNQWFKKSGVEIILYPVPMSISFECGVPYIFTVHDLQHRLQPQFPEVGDPKEWHLREYLFRNGVRNALVIVADSQVGREDVLSCYGEYGVPAEDVFALPFLPADYIPRQVDARQVESSRQRHGLSETYFFYPAQLWPHKNHARLVEALSILKIRDKLMPTLVLCGSHKNAIREATFSEVMALADKLGVLEQIRYLGFIPDDEMAALYAGAEGLLMPTFFGPTNIPILEAWSLGCPVMTSDIRGVREQAGDAAILVDPTQSPAIADAMARLLSDKEFCEELRGRGRIRLKSWGPDDFSHRLSEILSHARSRLSASGLRQESASYIS